MENIKKKFQILKINILCLMQYSIQAVSENTDKVNLEFYTESWLFQTTMNTDSHNNSARILTAFLPIIRDVLYRHKVTFILRY